MAKKDGGHFTCISHTDSSTILVALRNEKIAEEGNLNEVFPMWKTLLKENFSFVFAWQSAALLLLNY